MRVKVESDDGTMLALLTLWPGSRLEEEGGDAVIGWTLYTPNRTTEGGSFEGRTPLHTASTALHQAVRRLG